MAIRLPGDSLHLGSVSPRHRTPPIASTAFANALILITLTCRRLPCCQPSDHIDRSMLISHHHLDHQSIDTGAYPFAAHHPHGQPTPPASPTHHVLTLTKRSSSLEHQSPDPSHMRRPENERGRLPQPSPTGLARHPPARKVSGQRSPSPSANRRRLANTSSKTQLGNFGKLFEALNAKQKNNPATSSIEVASFDGSGSIALNDPPARQPVSYQTPRKPDVSPEDISDHQSTCTTPNFSDLQSRLISATLDIEEDKVFATANINSKLRGRDLISDNSQVSTSPYSVSPDDSDPIRISFESTPTGRFEHPRRHAGPPASINALSASLNSNSIGDKLLISTIVIDPPLTPPTSEEESASFPRHHRSKDIKARSKLWASSTSSTTPSHRSAHTTDGTPMLGSHLASILSTYSTSGSISYGQSNTATISTTPPPKFNKAALLTPSSENGQRLFEHLAAIAQPTSPTKVSPGQQCSDFFRSTVQNKFQSFDRGFETKFSVEMGNGIHVFIDWSNFLITCRETVRCFRGMGPQEKLNFWMNFDRVKYLIERQRPIQARHLAGSRGDSHAANKQLDYIKTTGYQVSDPQRRRTASSPVSEDTQNRKAEQCVDELLQLQMVQTLYRAKSHGSGFRPGVMVLASGDGQDAEFFTGGFYGLVQDALRDGWCVELYAFSSGLARVYTDAVALWDGRLTIHLLDDVAEALVEQD